MEDLKDRLAKLNKGLRDMTEENFKVIYMDLDKADDLDTVRKIVKGCLFLIESLAKAILSMY